MTRDRIAGAIYAALVLFTVFVLSAAAAGMWFGLAWRFVWVTAP